MPGLGVLRALHVTGAVLLLGNVTITGFWSLFFFFRRDQIPFGPTARAIMWADALFTLTGGALLAATGFMMAARLGLPVLHTPWLTRGLGALVGATLLWLVILLPDQWRMERVAPADDARLRRLFLRWSVAGWSATGLLFYGLWMMAGRGS